MKNFFTKILNFWNNWLWQKIVLLVASAVLSLIVMFIFVILGNNSGFWNAGAVLFFLWMRWFIITIPVVIIQSINNRIKAKKQKISEEQIKKDEETAQAITESIKEWFYLPMETDLMLPKWEVCLTAFAVAIYKERNITKGLAYSGFRYRIKIAKWLSYNIGTINPNIERAKVQYLDDKGLLYITNKRLIYKGAKKTDNMKFDQILSLEMIPWGVMISKNTGTVKVYNFLWEYKFFPVYMSALMNKEE